MVSSNSELKNEEQLILENTKLIHLVIKQMHLKWDTEDEFQSFYDSGLDGLMNAAKRYDPEKDNKFSTFACICIRSMIARYLYNKTRKKNFNENGKDISLNHIINEDNENLTEYGDFISDPKVNIEEEIVKKLEIERLLNAVDNLKNEKDKIAIKMYYGLDGFKEQTLEQVAKKMNVTKQMLQTRVSRARNKLKEYLEKHDRDVFIITPKKTECEVVMKEKTKKKENTLQTLNNYLFEQLSNLNDDNNDLDKEIRKSYAVTQLAQQIINNANTCIKAVKLANEHEIKDKKTLSLIGLDNE